MSEQEQNCKPAVNDAAQPQAPRVDVVAPADLRLLQASIGRLAQFMANPDSLYRAIRDKYGAGGTLPEQWQTLLELLPKSGPLMQSSGEKGKWLVDIFSSSPMVVASAPAAAAPPPPVAPAPPPPHPAEESPDEVEEPFLMSELEESAPEAASMPNWGPVPSASPSPLLDLGPTASPSPEDYSMELKSSVKPMKPIKFVTPEQAAARLNTAVLQEAIRTVQAIDAQLRQMTEERLNLDRMATELRVIDISPPFDAFVSSARAVTESQREGNNGVVDSASASVIHQYQENLRRASGSLLKSVFMAALLASSPGNVLNPRSLTGTLRFLSAELEFATLSAEQMDGLLSDLLIEAFQLGTPGIPLTAEFPFLADVSPSPEALREAANQAPRSASRLISIEDPSLVRRCYTNRTHNLILHLRSGKRLPPMSFFELRLLYAGKVTRFSGDPSAMPLGDYAYALRAAHAAGAEEFIMAVFLKLGFAGYVQKTLKETDVRAQIDPDLWQDLVEQADLTKDTPVRVLIVTVLPFPWPPSTTTAVVQLDPEMVQKLEIPRVTVCLTGKDVDGETTIKIRKLLPGIRVVPLEDATNVDEAIRRSLASPPKKGASDAPGEAKA